MSDVSGAVSGGLGFARFADLTRPGDADPYVSFERFAKLLEGSGIEGKLQFKILDGGSWRVVGVNLATAGTHLQQGGFPKPDLEIRTKLETWQQIAHGTLSPIEAFANGKMRVLGQYKLGPRIVRHLAASPGRIDLC